MTSYKKSEEANRCRERLIEILRKYEVTARKNGGQLKFLDRSLFIQAIAVSTRARKQSTSFETYFTKQVIPKANDGNNGNDQVLAFLEQKINIQALLKSPYITSEIEETELLPPNDILNILYLLIEKLQALIEENLLAYLAIKPMQECDESDEQEDMQKTDKVQAYVYLLYAMAYHEIFLHELLLEYAHRVIEDSQVWSQMIDEFDNPIMALKMCMEILPPALARYKIYQEFLNRQLLNWEAYRHLILMIEGYNIIYFRDKNQKEENDSSSRIECFFVDNLLEPGEGPDEYKFYYCCENMKANKNMTKLYKAIIAEVESEKLIPLVDEKKLDQYKFFMNAVRSYVNYISQNPKKNRTNEQEMILWKIMDQMGSIDNRCPC